MSLSSPVSPRPQPPASRPSLLLRAGLCLVALLAAVAALSLLAHRPPPPPVLGELPAFRLVAHDGRPFTRDSEHGKAFVADFIFTTCPGICPAMTARLAQLQPRLPEGVGIASFTVDPGHDTPEVLARYAADFKAGPAWRFVTGERDALYSLAVDGFKLAAMEVPPEQRQAGGDGPFLHSSRFVLVDGQARIRGYYDSEDRAALDQLVSDAMQVARHP